ncbi:uncharacterized protein LOC135398867 [Ornithodoros turicata]|uniref:uncharacterized protein LOC135398867 n=1 Tax=Ornithodoros turicata TaxID=34597 RepID=UPI00313936EB
MRNLVPVVGRRGHWDTSRSTLLGGRQRASRARSMSGMWFVVCIPKEDTVPSANKKDDGSPPAKVAKKNNNELNSRNINGDLRRREAEKNALNDAVESPMKQVLQDLLAQLGIEDAVWNAGPTDKYYQVCFPCEAGDETDDVLRALSARGIGVEQNSTVGVVPCAVFYRDYKDEGFCDDAISTIEEEKKISGFKAAHQRFLKSVRARLTVAQVVEGVRAQGDLNFDYVAFILLAGMIAALGLMDNSVVSIIAAMLVSPLMGPIMAITFGIRIRDRSLIKVGLRTELLGLFLCLTFGFFFGIIMSYWGDIEGKGGWSPNTWPNSEQTARGQWRSLWVGGLVALPSGAGVAMAILGGNSACLVGVAISASLLPPSINCGTLWSLSLMKVFKSLSQDPVNVTVPIPGTSLTKVVTTYPAFIAHSDFNAYYFDNANMHKECAVMAINSFGLTVVNILCIIIAGTVFLKIKEIAPEASMPRTHRFWKNDIKVARDYNRTFNDDDDLGHRFLEEWASITGVDPKVMSSSDPESRLTQLHTLQDILQDAEADDVYQTVSRQVANQPAVSLARRLTMGNIQPLTTGSRSGSTDYTSSPMGSWDPEAGHRAAAQRRPSHFVTSVLHNFERRPSKFHYAYDNPDGPTLAQELSPMPVNLQARRRSLYRFSVSPVSEEDSRSRRPSRISRQGGHPPVLEEEEFSRF